MTGANPQQSGTAPELAASARLRELSGWGTERTLNELDAMMWRTEDPPANGFGGTVMLLLDSVPEWDRVLKAHDRLTRLVPRFREKVVDPVLPIGRPYWAIDPHFELEYHVRRQALPEPGNVQQLLAFAQTVGLTPLARSRPPWFGILVEGLEGGRAAYLLRTMHVLMDGGAGTQLLSRVLATSRDPTGIEMPLEPEPSGPTPLEVTRRELARQTSELPGLAKGIVASAFRALRAPDEVARYAASVARVVRPPAQSRSPLLTAGRRESWRFGTLDCSLADLKSAAQAAGGTVNDAFVCAVLGGLRAYHDRHGHVLDDVPMSMPVSVRKPGEMGGNRFTGAFFSAPSGLADPAVRMAEIRRRVGAVRAEPALDIFASMNPILNRIPAGVAQSAVGAMNKHTALMTSSWPGVTDPCYMAGAQVERMYTFGPLPHTRLSAAMCSHVGVCCIGFNADADVFPDSDLLWECMREGLDEVLGLRP